MKTITLAVSAATSRRRFIWLIAFLSMIGGSIFLHTELFAQQPSRTAARKPDLQSELGAEAWGKVTVHPPDVFYRPPTEVPNKPGAMNADASVDIYFGPKPPKGFESNWIPTQGKRPMPMMRIYGGEAAYWNRTFKMPDAELVEWEFESA